MRPTGFAELSPELQVILATDPQAMCRGCWLMIHTPADEWQAILRGDVDDTIDPEAFLHWLRTGEGDPCSSTRPGTNSSKAG